MKTILTAGYNWEKLEQIQSFSHKDAFNFYHTYYNPNNAVLSIVGNCSFEEAKALVEKYYAKLENNFDNKNIITDIEIKKGFKEKTIYRDIPYEAIFIGNPIPKDSLKSFM